MRLKLCLTHHMIRLKDHMAAVSGCTVEYDYFNNLLNSEVGCIVIVKVLL